MNKKKNCAQEIRQVKVPQLALSQTGPCPRLNPPTRVVNPRLAKSGRAVPARKFEWTGPGRNFSRAGPGRSSPKFLRAGPGRFFCEYSAKILPISAIFLNEQYLILDELLIKFKFSLKNLLKILIEIKLSMTGPRFQLGRPGPKI